MGVAGGASDGQKTFSMQDKDTFKILSGQEILKATQRYLGVGLSVIPCHRKTKKPTISWKHHQENPIIDATAFEWPGIAIICGKVFVYPCYIETRGEGMGILPILLTELAVV